MSAQATPLPVVCLLLLTAIIGGLLGCVAGWILRLWIMEGRA